MASKKKAETKKMNNQILGRDINGISILFYENGFQLHYQRSFVTDSKSLVFRSLKNVFDHIKSQTNGAQWAGDFPVSM